jgi:alpha-glucosidase (family GH31 glycosyl hydrolase)
MAMLAAPLGRPPMLAREGAIIPVNRAPAHFGADVFEPGFLLFPTETGETAIELFADDGESVVDVAGAVPSSRITVSSDPSRIEVNVAGYPRLSEAAFIPPPGERRPIRFTPS